MMLYQVELGARAKIPAPGAGEKAFSEELGGMPGTAVAASNGL